MITVRIPIKDGMNAFQIKGLKDDERNTVHVMGSVIEPNLIEFEVCDNPHNRKHISDFFPKAEFLTGKIAESVKAKTLSKEVKQEIRDVLDNLGHNVKSLAWDKLVLLAKDKEPAISEKYGL